jgi:hypothetical protein
MAAKRKTIGAMKAQLTDGSMVELVQDCDCTTHTGPHWLHMSDIERRLNEDALAQKPDSESLQQWFAHVEINRLQERARHMQWRNIVRIIRE